ncbi:MAG TPA: heparinase II/III family protein, partial [Thermoanaerobaculia bacterium]|nr:heparinase II/III family protein [Thermoanaerobaculia bacterium]
EGESDAYRSLTDPVSHRRRVLFVESRFWIVVDDLDAVGTHHIDLRFQFAPVDVAAMDGAWIRATAGGTRGLLLRAFAPDSFAPRICSGGREPMEGWVSRHYGRMEPAPAVVFSATAKLPIRIATVLWPAEDVTEAPDVNTIDGADGRPAGIRVGERTVMFET